MGAILLPVPTQGACEQGRPSSGEGSAVAGAPPPIIVVVSSRESQYGSTDWQIDYRSDITKGRWR
ncbi:hypothetical protein E2562_006843 [Oryza meyeriana var. granulata]|uniref:Uncharacterized protein n=1 Tax=Oryza meyeriana var. granulata TaxID=110450 RepID=A0A6G1C4N5_9ORYZ|nr:hypothetical protein E2562_006843 [Oryza meyeriana var. granulata]